MPITRASMPKLESVSTSWRDSRWWSWPPRPPTALLRLRIFGEGSRYSTAGRGRRGVQRQLLGRRVEPHLRRHGLVRRTSSSTAGTSLRLGAGRAPRAATPARPRAARTRARRRTGRRTPGCRRAARGARFGFLAAPPGTAVSVGRAGRPLAVAPGHLAAQPRAGLGRAGDVLARPAHDQADRGPGQEHDRGQRAQRDQDVHPDAAHQMLEQRACIGADQAAVLLRVDRVRGRQREHQRGHRGRDAQPQRAQASYGAIEKDQRTGADRDRRHDHGRLADQEPEQAIQLLAHHSPIPAQILDAREEDPGGEKCTADEVVPALKGRAARRTLPLGGLRADGGLTRAPSRL